MATAMGYSERVQRERYSGRLQREGAARGAARVCSESMQPEDGSGKYKFQSSLAPAMPLMGAYCMRSQMEVAESGDGREFG